jgi:hypothetical protein
MAQPRRNPSPPADFRARDLPLERVPAGTSLVRIHRTDRGALYFGVTGTNRFDDPQSAYGVCDFALTHEGAFAETCLRDVGAPFVATSFLSARSFARIEVIEGLRLVTVHGPGLARLGATSVVTGGDHGFAQTWSRAIHEHPASPDGLLYRANHDNGEICAALFERCSNKLRAGASEPILSDRERLGGLLDRYKVGLG